MAELGGGLNDPGYWNDQCPPGMGFHIPGVHKCVPDGEGNDEEDEEGRASEEEEEVEEEEEDEVVEEEEEEGEEERCAQPADMERHGHSEDPWIQDSARANVDAVYGEEEDDDDEAADDEDEDEDKDEDEEDEDESFDGSECSNGDCHVGWGDDTDEAIDSNSCEIDSIAASELSIERFHAVRCTHFSLLGP